MAKTKEEKIESKLDPVIQAIIGKVNFQGRCGFGSFIEDREKLSSGSLSFDLKLGGGWSRDRVLEFYGGTGSFKTTMAMLLVKNYIERFGYIRYPLIVDLERTITANFVRGFGLDPDKIMVARPTTGEETFDLISGFIRSGKVGITVIDSIDALESEEDQEKSFSEASMMKLPKLLSEAMRDLSKATVDNDSGLICINQCRTGLMNGFKAYETTSGGKALPYYASQRAKFSKVGPSDNYSDALKVKASIKKNKLFPLLIESEAEFDMVPGQGIVKGSDYIFTGKELGLVKQAGPYYSLMDPNDENKVLHKWQGAKKFAEWLNEDKVNMEMYEDLVKTKFHEIKESLAVHRTEDEQNEIEAITNDGT